MLGGGWYECPNGHTYHVDQCGKPMEKLNCPTCGAVIGGIDHELDPSNKKKATSQDQTSPGMFRWVLAQLILTTHRICFGTCAT